MMIAESERFVKAISERSISAVIVPRRSVYGVAPSLLLRYRVEHCVWVALREYSPRADESFFGHEFYFTFLNTMATKGSCFVFDTVSVGAGKRGILKKGNAGNVEFFAVYLPENGKVYMIAVTDAPNKH